MATLSSRLTPLTVSVPAMSEWTSYTPTIFWTNTTQTGRWRRVGDSIQIMIDLSMTGAPASMSVFPVTEILSPLSLTIDNTKFPNITDVRLNVGAWNALDSGVAGSYSGIVYYDGTNIGMAYPTGATTATLVTTTQPFTWGASDNLAFTVTLPISSWTSHTASATSANAVVVGGQSVGSTMNFGATSNQGFNILANNVAAIASTAAGALTLGLPSAIGGSTYAGQAIVGRTNGTAISAGYVGERISATGGGIVTGSMPAANIVANVNSMSLTPGIWHVFGSVAFSSGATTVFGADNYVGASISTTSATENAANANFIFFSSTGAGVTRNSSTFDTLNLSATTTVYLTTRHGATTIGGASYLAIGTTGARFYAIRIA